MSLLNVEIIKYSDEEVEDFQMDNNRTYQIEVVPFRLVINYNVEDEQDVLKAAKEQLENYVATLAEELKSKM